MRLGDRAHDAEPEAERAAVIAHAAAEALEDLVAQLDGDTSIVPALEKLIARDDLPTATIAKAVLVLKAKSGGSLASSKLSAAAGKRLIEAVEKGSLKIASPADQLVMFVDGMDIGDPADVALRDRRMLSADGIFIVVATISEQDGSSVAEPEVIFRGVPFVEEAGQLVNEIRDEVEASLARAAGEEIREIDLLQEVLHDDLAEFVYDRLRRRPMVLPVVVEV